MNSSPPAHVTLGQFTAAFVPFGVLLIVVLGWPEVTQALDLNRTKATIWGASILLIPALVLYPFHSVSSRVANLAHLYWGFAYLIFLAHAYWAVFVIFNGVVDTFRQMGTRVAGVNFLLVIWWSLDVLVLWTVRTNSNGLAIFQWATRIFVFVIFAITLIFLRGGPVRTLGVVFTASVLAALAVRLWARTRQVEGKEIGT